MPEETASEVNKPLFAVERNEVQLQFVEGKFTRGKNKNKPYPRPLVEDMTIEQLIAYLEPKRAYKLLANKLKSLAKAWYGESTDENGDNFDEGLFKNLAFQISAQGEKIADLVEAYEALQDDLNDVLANMSMDAGLSDVDKERIIEIRDEMKAVKLAIKNKRRKTDEEKAQAEGV
jgi:hypothetical protein